MTWTRAATASPERIGQTLRSGRAATIPFRRADTTLDPRLFGPSHAAGWNQWIEESMLFQCLVTGIESHIRSSGTGLGAISPSAFRAPAPAPPAGPAAPSRPQKDCLRDPG